MTKHQLKKAKQALSAANKEAWKKQQAFKVPMDREGQLREAERLQEQEKNKGKPVEVKKPSPQQHRAAQREDKRVADKQILSEANKQAWKNLQGSARDQESWRRETERLLQEWNGKIPVKKKAPKQKGTPKSPPQPKPLSAEEKAALWDRMNALWAAYEERLGRHKLTRRGETREDAEKRWFENLIKPLTEAEVACMRQLAARYEARKKLQADKEAQQKRRVWEIAEAGAKQAFAILKEQRLRAIEEQEKVKRRRKAERQRERERERARAAEIPKEKRDAYLWLVGHPERQDQRILDHYGGSRDWALHLVAVVQQKQLKIAENVCSAAEDKQLKWGIRQLRRHHWRSFGIELVQDGMPLRDEAVLEHYVKATTRAFSVYALEQAGLDSTMQRVLVVQKIREDHLADLCIPLVWELSDECIDDPVAMLDELFGSDA